MPQDTLFISRVMFLIFRTLVGVRKIHSLLTSGQYLWNKGPGVGSFAARVLTICTK